MLVGGWSSPRPDLIKLFFTIYKEIFMYKYLFLMALVMPSLSFAATPKEAADEVLAQDSKDLKCAVFFKHFKRYHGKNDYSSGDILIAYIDAKESGLVDYCDDRSGDYL